TPRLSSPALHVARPISLVGGYYNTMQLNDGQLLGELADDCTRVSNGVDLTHGENVPAEGCRAQFEIGYYQPVDRVRARRYPIVRSEEHTSELQSRENLV